MLSAAAPELYKDKINPGVVLLCVGSHNASYFMLFFTSIMNPLNLDFMFFYTINWKRLQMVFYLSSYADQYHDLISPSFGCSPVTSRHRK